MMHLGQSIVDFSPILINVLVHRSVNFTIQTLRMLIIKFNKASVTFNGQVRRLAVINQQARNE